MKISGILREYGLVIIKGLYEKNIKQLTEIETISFRNNGLYLYVKTSCLDLTTPLIPCLLMLEVILYLFTLYM